jgi:nicotinamide mononucleotide transporter
MDFDLLTYAQENPFELIGTIFGLFCVYLNTRANVWGWVTGIISVGAYVFVFWKANLYGDCILHIIYVILSIYGLYHWLYGGKGVDNLTITKSSNKELIFVLFLGAIGTPILGYIFTHYFTNSYQPYWDAGIFSFSLVAQWQLAQKRIENWLLWIGVDMVAVWLYFSKGLIFTGVLYLIFLGLATLGYLQWKKELKMNAV